MPAPKTRRVTPCGEPSLGSAAVAFGLPVDILTASDIAGIDVAFASLAQSSPDALVVAGNTLFANRRAQIVTLATHQRLPTISVSREYPQEGGLMSYGTLGDDSDRRQVGLYTRRILKGEKAGDLPVIQGAKFEFVINLRTAKAFGFGDAARPRGRGD